MNARESRLKRGQRAGRVSRIRGRHGMVEVRHHPRRRALEEVQLGDAAAGCRAPPAPRWRPSRSAPTRFPVRSSSWSHRAVWKALPSKRSRPGKRRAPRLAEQARARPRARAPRAGRPRSRAPSAARRPPSVAPSSSQPSRVCGSTPKRSRAVAQVLQDLVAHRVRAVPVVVRRERERVEVRGDVALAARVAVRPPGAAHVVAALEQDEVLDALLLQADRHAEAAEAGAHDRHLVHVRVVHPPDAIRAVSCPG